MAGVLAYDGIGVLQEAHVELCVWEAGAGFELLTPVLVTKDVRVTQPELVIAVMERDGRDEEREMAGDWAGVHGGWSQ
jgi:hypothetical protein